MTPRQVAALRIVHLQKMRREELLFGIVAATSANYSFSTPQPPLDPRDFMINRFPPEPERPLTGEDFMRVFAHFRKPN